MVNYKRVVCEVAVLVAVASLTIAAPAPDCPHAHIDQRQNGTENYRLSIDGVVIAVAPAETFLDAASDIGDLFDQSDIEFLLKPSESPSKPEVSKPEESSPEKPEVEDPVDKPLSDVSVSSDISAQKKDASVKKQEKAQRLKTGSQTF